MKAEMKVLLYLKRNERDAAGFCPLMGKITLKGKQNSTAQFACKIRVNPEIWNSTSQRCTGKSRLAVRTNKEIESRLLLIRRRFDELCDTGDSFSALDVKNAFQGIASAQATLLKFFQEYNDEYALRVGVNRTEASYYHYRNTRRILSEFIRFKYKVSDIALKSLVFLFIESFDSYMRMELKYQPVTRLGHIKCLRSIIRVAIHKGILAVNPFDGFSPEKPEKKQLYLTEEELSRLMKTTFDTPNRNFTRDMFLFSVFTGICYCDMRNLSQVN
ncbi:phage integrase SAM-like domain-containing protein, partial [Dysgonomonas sp.]